MLKSLEIKNYAIIEHIVINFDEKLNIITGETGAGKSILLGALGLTLGERADTKSLYSKDNKCFVEAIFILKNNKLKKFFKKNELDFEKETSIRREIAISGKSRAFINDTPVTLNVLKSLTEQLVNLHSQKETGELNENEFQVSVVDFSAKNTAQLSKYQKILVDYKSLKKTLKETIEKNELLQKDLDFNLFQLKEINESNLEGNILENLESELAVLNHAEEIKTTLWDVVSGIDNDNMSVLSILNDLSIKLSKISEYSTDLTSLNKRVESVLVEIQDIKNESEIQSENTDLDEEKIIELTEMVNVANKLLLKHGLNSIEELQVFKTELEEKTASVADTSNLITSLENDIEEKENVLNLICEELHLARKNAIPKIEKTLTDTLKRIGMPNANFVINLSNKDKFDQFGKDEVKFLFSSNKGFEPQDLTKIASGGELSRVMLSIKSLLAGSADLPTLIFDEIDTGISGEVASKVGEVFKEISRKHQLISITHLPQIASKADKHLFIYKEDSSEKTKTKMAALTAEQHVKAIARMLSGNKITDASLENAKLLIES